MNRRHFFQLLAVGTAAVYLRLAPERTVEVPTCFARFDMVEFEEIMDRIYRTTRPASEWVLIPRDRVVSA